MDGTDQAPIVVDLTNTDNEPPEIITLDDKTPPAKSKRPTVFLSDSDSDSDSDIQVSGPGQMLGRRFYQRTIHHCTAINRRLPAALRTILPKISETQPNNPPPSPPSPQGSLKCPICLETYLNVKQRGLKVVVTRCGHIFCDFCLKKAISDNGRKCPKCRKNIPKGPTGFIEIFDVC